MRNFPVVQIQFPAYTGCRVKTLRQGAGPPVRRKLSLLFAALACLLPLPASAVPSRPNIIVILTDDQGYADVAAQGLAPDVRTPHIDSIAKNGVRFTDGYVTAPQCSPSRAALLTGRYGARFGFDEINDCPLPPEEATLAERLRDAGYATGMVGKWHLDPNDGSRAWLEKHGIAREDAAKGLPRELTKPYQPETRGFSDVFDGHMKSYFANYGLDGKDIPGGRRILDERFRVDVQTDAALAFIGRHKADPFFLYLAYFAPHVPPEATPEYLARHPGTMAERRRYALAMISAVDGGVGRVLAALAEAGIEKDTLVFFISDNGAPLLGLKDLPVSFEGGAWDGSLNSPLTGEKGMLAEGGIRVPFLAQWPSVLPAGTVCREPVITLDVAATALAAAGVKDVPGLDGVNLVPYLTGKVPGAPHGALFWRFWHQAAVREGHWKYLVADGSEFLFDLEADVSEQHNLFSAEPERAARLRARLENWASGLLKPGLDADADAGQLAGQRMLYETHFPAEVPSRK